MDRWLKLLIAAACCVVIAGGGYFAWSEYHRSVEEKRLAEYRTWQRVCDLMLSEFKSHDFTEDWRVFHITKCVVDGHLSERNFNTADLRSYLEKARKNIDYELSQKPQ